MRTRKLHNLTVSEVGMAFSHGYGQNPSEQYSIEAIQNGYDHGCTFFDTAEVYSPGLSGIGHNELIVGKALKDVRENVVIATKLFLAVARSMMLCAAILKPSCVGCKLIHVLHCFVAVYTDFGIDTTVLVVKKPNSL